MNPEHEENLREANEAFLKLSDEKYRAGQQEHGGNLWEVPGLIDEAMNEVIDMWHYLFNLKKQITKVKEDFQTYKQAVSEEKLSTHPIVLSGKSGRVKIV